jgi:hypothetical protein
MSAAFFRLPMGIGAPSTIVVPLRPLPTVAAGAPLDMTTITGVVFQVARPDGSQVANWSGTIQSGATVGAANAIYAFIGTEFDVNGLWKIRPYAIVPGGQVPCQEAVIAVEKPT